MEESLYHSTVRCNTHVSMKGTLSSRFGDFDD